MHKDGQSKFLKSAWQGGQKKAEKRKWLKGSYQPERQSTSTHTITVVINKLALITEKH